MTVVKHQKFNLKYFLNASLHNKFVEAVIIAFIYFEDKKIFIQSKLLRVN